MHHRAGDVRAALFAATEAVDVWGELSGLQPLLCMSSSVGAAGGDLALATALSMVDLTTMQQQALYTHLPAMCAAVFISDRWAQSVFMPEVDAFENNEQCMQLAISQLLFIMFTHTELQMWSNRSSVHPNQAAINRSNSLSAKSRRDGSYKSDNSNNGVKSVADDDRLSVMSADSAGVGDASGSVMDDAASGDGVESGGGVAVASSAGSGSCSADALAAAVRLVPPHKPQIISGIEMRQKFQKYVSGYLNSAAQLVLLAAKHCQDGIQHNTSNGTSEYLPYNSMAYQLVHFSRITSVYPYSLLEEKLPYSIVQSGMLEAYLGRISASDALGEFPAHTKSGSVANSVHVE
jgi:hypothetical protein